MRKVLVLAAHPDDETLGCGGTLLKHKASGDEIRWLIATCMREEDGFQRERIVARKEEIERVTTMYGFDEVYNLDVPAMKTDEIPIGELVNRISTIFQLIKPETLYLPFKGDIHSDHRILFEAAYSCTKAFRHPLLKRVAMYETISETEFAPSLYGHAFIPNYFIDVSDFLHEKLEIMRVYKSEIGEHPFPRSIENIKSLATFRGATAGCQYAESFVILKEIW
ncbi:MAG: PIG-L deacetylase family protein [Nitrospirota bacterium]